VESNPSSQNQMVVYGCTFIGKMSPFFSVQTITLPTLLFLFFFLIFFFFSMIIGVGDAAVHAQGADTGQ